ncbi:MAG: ATP synthase F1 subunit gamma [Candidatus Dadabacteria bacterium]|nr:ATP synthase F1 subunit gamma [Candidatus Dadabacteria bacterium]
MPSLKQIRTKINSVKGTRRIMSAMKLISAVKLQKVQGTLLSSRPYSHAMKEIAGSIALRCDPEWHPLLRDPEETKNIQLVFMTSDRGLCGSFNSNLIRKIETYMVTDAPRYENVSFRFIGRRGRDHFARSGVAVTDSVIGLNERNYGDVSGAVSKALVREYTGGRIDEAVLVYNYFKSALTQIITFERVLPIEPLEGASEQDGVYADYKYEPQRKELLDGVLPRYVEARVQRAVLETLTSEQASRMTAMDNATRNADSVISQLTLLFNKTRQANVTSELMDIVNGTESMKKGG